MPSLTWICRLLACPTDFRSASPIATHEENASVSEPFAWFTLCLTILPDLLRFWLVYLNLPHPSARRVWLQPCVVLIDDCNLNFLFSPGCCLFFWGELPLVGLQPATPRINPEGLWSVSWAPYQHRFLPAQNLCPFVLQSLRAFLPYIPELRNHILYTVFSDFYKELKNSWSHFHLLHVKFLIHVSGHLATGGFVC